MSAENSVWTLSTVWTALKKNWTIIVAATLLGAVAGFTVASVTAPIFQSRATLFVSINQGSSGTELNQGTTYAQNQMQSFARLATSSRVLDPVIDELGLSLSPLELARNIEVVTPRDTVILTIQVSSTSPQRAADISNAVADSLADVVGEVSPSNSEGGPSITASTVDEAVVPQFQVSPSKPRDTLLAGAVGFLFGLTFALLRTLLDTRMPTTEVLRQVVTSPVLGSISRVPKSRDGVGLVVAREPLGRSAEEFRVIRSALTYAGVSDRVQRVLVTSTSQSEGKSSFSANFALTLSGLRSRVLLIDADLRRPRIADVFGVEGSVGLTTVLLGDISFEEAKLPWHDSGLDILTAGVIPPNPSEMLTSEAMHRLLDTVSEQYDYVIIDSPPIQSVADANLLSPMVDGAILVVDASRTRRSNLRAAMTSFDGAGGRILGVVLNKVRRHRRADAYYTQSGRPTTLQDVSE
jgi:capsular exopolysaccharide synthesis family protein